MGRLKYTEAEKKLVEIMTSPRRDAASRASAEALGAMGAHGSLEKILSMLEVCSKSEDYKDVEMARSVIPHKSRRTTAPLRKRDFPCAKDRRPMLVTIATVI